MHGCKYCYARFMKRFTGHTEPWGSFVDIKNNAPDLIPKGTNKLITPKMALWASFESLRTARLYPNQSQPVRLSLSGYIKHTQLRPFPLAR